MNYSASTTPNSLFLSTPPLCDGVSRLEFTCAFVRRDSEQNSSHQLAKLGQVLTAGVDGGRVREGDALLALVGNVPEERNPERNPHGPRSKAFNGNSSPTPLMNDGLCSVQYH